MRVCIPKVGSGRKFTTEARRTPGVRDRMSATLIGRFDRINRMSTRCMRDGNHPVDPVHPVKTSSSSGKVGKVIGELHCSVPPCLRASVLPWSISAYFSDAHTCESGRCVRPNAGSPHSGESSHKTRAPRVLANAATPHLQLGGPLVDSPQNRIRVRIASIRSCSQT